MSIEREKERERDGDMREWERGTDGDRERERIEIQKAKEGEGGGGNETQQDRVREFLQLKCVGFSLHSRPCSQGSKLAMRLPLLLRVITDCHWHRSMFKSSIVKGPWIPQVNHVNIKTYNLNRLGE